MMTNAASCKRVISPETNGAFDIFNCLRSTSRNTIKFGLGSLLNYTQVFNKEKDKLSSPFEVVGDNGGL